MAQIINCSWISFNRTTLYEKGVFCANILYI